MFGKGVKSLILLLLLGVVMSILTTQAEAKVGKAAMAANDDDDYDDGGDDYADYNNVEYGSDTRPMFVDDDDDDFFFTNDQNDTVNVNIRKIGAAGGSGPLCVAFRTLRNVVPMKTLIRIMHQHYRYDLRFRRALNFIQSWRFTEAAKEIEATEAYQTMLSKFQAAGVDTSEMHISTFFDCLLMPVISLVQNQTPYYAVTGTEIRHASRSNAIVPGARSFTSFTRDLYMIIPRSKFRASIGTLLSTNAQFANFYRMLSNLNFRRDVVRGLSTKSMMEATRTLRQNFINMRQLLGFVFRVFSLGP